MEKFVLKKIDCGLCYYFKCRDSMGHTNSLSLEDAMIFNSKNEAIDYNHRWLYGDYEAIKTASSQQ